MGSIIDSCLRQLQPPVGQTGYINISPGTAPPICCSGKALGLRNHPNILITHAIVSDLKSSRLTRVGLAGVQESRIGKGVPSRTYGRSSILYFLVEVILYIYRPRSLRSYLHFIKLYKQDSPNFIKTAIVPDGTYLTSFNYTIGCP